MLLQALRSLRRAASEAITGGALLCALALLQLPAAAPDRPGEPCCEATSGIGPPLSLRCRLTPGESPAAPGILARAINPTGADHRPHPTAGQWITGASRKGQRRESEASSRAQPTPWARCTGPTREKRSASCKEPHKPSSSKRDSSQCATGWDSIRVH
jgi:hypothetical protein